MSRGSLDSLCCCRVRATAAKFADYNSYRKDRSGETYGHRNESEIPVLSRL